MDRERGGADPNINAQAPSGLPMRTALWAALLLGLVAAAVAAAAANPAPAIVNGQDAPKGRYRFMASLRPTNDNKTHWCGGTLIHPRVVLTAAHCVLDDKGNPDVTNKMFQPLVRIGGYAFNSDAPSEYQQRRTQQTVTHPNYVPADANQEPMNHDAALLLLDAPSTMPRIKLVGPLYKPKLPVPAGTRVMVTGWGYNSSAQNTFPERLQQLSLNLFSNQECQKRLGNFNGDSYNFYTNAMICAADVRPPIGDSCKADSGGPLFVAGPHSSKDLQIGVVSWGPPCPGTGAYTDLGMIYKWIDDQVFKWTGDRLGPWTPVTGTVLADNKGVGFDRTPTTYAGAKGDPVDIITSEPAVGMGWSLNGILTDGSALGTQALGYVAWNFGARVEAQIVPTAWGNRMVVKLNQTPIKQGRTLNLGKLVTIAHAREHCRRGWCAPRQLDITVRPFIKIAITQPWIPAATWGARGSYAPYLEVKVTLTQKPAQQPTGIMGQTIVA